VLAFPADSRSEAPKTDGKGTETLVAKRRSESLAETERLMEEVCEWENCKQALQRVKANKGSPGVDGMTVEQLPDYLKQHGPEIREQLLTGTYEPKPVRRVEIPKPDGGVRKLGIPSVLDRFVQQAALQVLQKIAAHPQEYSLIYWTFPDGACRVLHALRILLRDLSPLPHLQGCV
jgi:RNA-directed DNA polymerase